MMPIIQISGIKSTREEMELASERKGTSILRMELEWAKHWLPCKHQAARPSGRLEALKNGKAPVQRQMCRWTLWRQNREKDSKEIITFQSYGDKVILDDFDYIVLRNQRLGIIGPNGCGKSTLIVLLTGMVEPDSGTVESGERSDRLLRPGGTGHGWKPACVDYIRDVAGLFLPRDGKIELSMMLERFLFDSAMQYTPGNSCPGGERRLYLLKVLMETPNLNFFWMSQVMIWTFLH